MTHTERFPGETIDDGGRYPMLVWRGGGAASADRPLIVLAPGGGHLARIFYGHPEAEPRDFLAHWLIEAGFEVLAASYPSNHPANRADCADMTRFDWTEEAARVAARAAAGRPVVLVGWSGAGQMARNFRVAIAEHGVVCDLFIGLAATAPLPNLATPPGHVEPVTAEGLWDSSTRDAQWLAALDKQKQADGRAPIDPEAYRRHYRCDNPIGFRSEPRPDRGPARLQLADLLERGRPFDFADYPLCASIIPQAPWDARHAMTDRATWGFFNAQMLYCRLAQRLGPRLSDLDLAVWAEALEHLDALPEALTRKVEGGHFFFVGESGARATSAHIVELLSAVRGSKAGTLGIWALPGFSDQETDCPD